MLRAPDEYQAAIASASYDPAYGARHLQRNIERGFLSLIASSEHQTIHVVVDDRKLALGRVRRRK